MDQAIEESTFGLGYLGSILGSCGVIALALSITGIYSVMAYSVSQRAHEFGVRMALGATGPQVMLSTLRHAAMLTGAGLTIGSTLALLMGQLMQSSVLGIVAFDPTILVFASLALALASLGAAFFPARRVLRLDPVPILRSQ